MIYLIGPKRVVWAISLAVIALVSIWTFVNPAPEAMEVWKTRGVVVIILSGLVSLVSLRPILWLVHTVSFGKHWWFPWLGGTWVGEVRSNWPLVKAMLAAKGGNAVDGTEGAHAPLLIPIQATIKVGLFDIEIVLRPKDSERVSRTLFVRPSWCKPSLPIIHYIYEQREGGVVAPTDRRTHLGAACLAYDPDTERLEGEYWTERSADLGINTAGTIILKRAPKTAENRSVD